MSRRSWTAVCLAMTLGLAPTAGHAADSGSGAAAVKHLSATDAALFSKQIERDLAAKGARVALVFRTGRPRKDLPKGLAYTHGAFWVYQPAQAADGHVVNGYAVYNLYQGDGKTRPVDQGYLAQDFPFDFTAGSIEDDVAVILPTPEMQQRILDVMASPTYQRMFNPSYSLIGNPLRAQHQNCDDFLLDIVAAAAWQTSDPRQVRADLVAHFAPSVVKTSALERFFAPVVDEGIKTDDQSGPIITAAYESIAGFMHQYSLSDETYVIHRQP
jgi:hypothetical protein